MATDYQAFDAAWRSYLNSLGKVWVKAERACHDIPRFQPWQGRYKSIQKADPLLRYLKHARDADQHTLEEITELQPGSKSFGPAEHGNWHIEKLVLTGPDAEVTEYRGNQPMLVKVSPPKPILRPFVNLGARYEVPTRHLDKDLEELDPISIAEAGIAFYSEFLTELVKEFFPNA